MSKAIRWQVFFKEAKPESENPKQYRVDIYDEQDSSWSGITELQAGDTPFVTDEDNSDNFFAPIRTQTGTLQICTLLPNTTDQYITLDELLPANNIARPVRLLKYANGSYSVIEWQGFLSCEAYSQDYIGIPQNLDLPLIGVLEAMDSIEVDLNEDMAFKKILGHVAYAMKAIETKSGMALFDQVYIASYVKEALTTQYFYNNVYFEADEQISGDNITVDVHSISCKAILEQVAKFFGCCWREKGQNIYLQSIGKYSYAFHSFGSIYNTYVAETTGIVWLYTPGAVGDLEDCDWMGNGHQRSVTQGMRRVKVTSKLDDFDCKMALEECPVNNLVENPETRQATWGEVHVNTNETFYSQATHKHRRCTVKVEQDSSAYYGKKATMQMGYNVSGINYENTWHWADDDYRTNFEGLFLDVTGSVLVGTVAHYCTSFMAWVRLTKEEENESHGHDTELVSGLMVCGLPDKYRIDNYQTYLWTIWPDLVESNYLFRQSTPLIFAASSGKFTFEMEIGGWATQEKFYTTWEKKRGLNEARGIEMAVKWGDKWLQYADDAFSWTNAFTTFHVEDGENYSKTGFDGKIKKEFPVIEYNSGIISVYLFPKIYGNTEGVDMIRGMAHNLFITKLDLKYEAPEEELRTDRSENVYATETSQAFRDELSVDCELASYANNTKLATMIWNDSTTPAKLISLGGATVRPEVDLLNRLATYYGAARQRLELEVAHISTPLPNLKLKGIGDRKVYLPLAESRDWRTGVCKLTCFEMHQ